MKVGLGFDVHAFDAARPLVLGGVVVPDAPGLAGHSDADVVSHALSDALLGAAGLGDLGSMFPPTEVWRDASSLEILASSAGAARDAGWELVNADVTVIAERPRLAPYRAAMAARMAEALGAEAGVISVKATTSDGLGFTGRGEGIAAIAVVLLKQAAAPPIAF
ncbi:MAG: 2-C-methyl-D-erythritol 2,4-cyclodiphosphate synthase [Actinomycetota bacterium]|nr:2-C-methyl-D-erythritol 2,4-cyclodiphosphate synthase [Actinomycetota bacterium]